MNIKEYNGIFHTSGMQVSYASSIHACTEPNDVVRNICCGCTYILQLKVVR